ncbi:histidinol-phosphate transaminase [Candidatus Ruminimicrobiellum ovillum]|uniref:histidinol-phosphate transaminase n=1 Tax=Candidatus Ruminimicrobiellum ovillum TaxID=1947927 RepID=UPI00355A3364
MGKFDAGKLARSVCKTFQPYVAGKPIETLKRELGLKHIIKIASNENPLGPSKKAVKAMKDMADKVYFYPDFNSTELKMALAKHYKLKINNIIVGCGSDELIEIIARAYFNPEDEVVISKYSFTRYQMAVKLMNAKSVVVPMKEGFVHDLKAMAKACNKNTKAVFITNPNNPTGTYNTKKEFEEFLKDLPLNKYGVKPLVISDEAYCEFASYKKDFPDTLKYLAKNPNLIILRTFSKIYAMAGARVGYGLVSETVSDYIERIRPPFNVNKFAQAGAIASLNDKSQVKRSVAHVRKEFKFIFAALNKMGIKYIDSVGNFFLMSVAPFKGKQVFQDMLKEGVIIRAMDEYELYDYVRVTIGTRKENELFLKKIKKVLKK